MTNHPPNQDDAELDSFDAKLRERVQQQVRPSTAEAAADEIWQSIQAELRRETNDVSSVERVKAESKPDYFSYRNLLALAAVGLFAAVGSMFLVAAKQRNDGTVLSTVTHVERVMRRERRNENTNHEWLPEEREIWRQLMEQTAAGAHLDSTVAVEQSLQKD